MAHPRFRASKREASRRTSAVLIGATAAAGLLLAGCGSGSGSGSAGVSVAQVQALQTQVQHLTQQLDSTKTRVTHLEDAEAIKKLERAYGYYISRGLWSQVVDLFTDDGTVELGGEGIYKGKKGVARLFSLSFGAGMGRGPGKDGLGKGVLFNHPQLAGIVDVSPDGKTAHGRWMTLAQVAWHGKSAMWNEGVYENTYVKQNGVWKISQMHFWSTYFTPYLVGWAKQKGGETDGPDHKYPPDELSPPQDGRTLYPDHYYAEPFHFPNPVTGQPTPLPAPF